MDDYDETGPPTQADEDWYWHHVVLAQDRPPARNRQGEPMNGQMTLPTYAQVAEAHRINATRNTLANCRCEMCWEENEERSSRDAGL